MFYQVVAIRDRQLNAYMRPWFAQTVNQAIRTFVDELNREAPDNELAKHPEDYDLYHLATFDDNSGQFINTKTQPQQLCVGSNSKKPIDALTSPVTTFDVQRKHLGA